MDRVYFVIFTPDKKKFRLTPNWIVLILWGITILFLWLFESIIPVHSTFRNVWLGCVLIINIYYLISSFLTYEPLNGVLGGEIEFTGDSIRVNNKAFELKNINKLDFLLIDFYGKLSNTVSANFNPLKSLGVRNYVQFNDDSNKSQLIHFKLESKNGFIHLVPFINEAVRLNKMSSYRATDLIGEENVITK